MQGFCFYISIKKDNKIEYMSHTKKNATILNASTHFLCVRGERQAGTLQWKSNGRKYLALYFLNQTDCEIFRC